jgi:hypothetical protein
MSDIQAAIISTVPMSVGSKRALALLRDAYCYAFDATANVWDFAVEIGELRSTGANASDLRWLVAKRLVEHGVERTEHADELRQYSYKNSLRFADRSCFVLTELGYEFVKRGWSNETEFLQPVDRTTSIGAYDDNRSNAHGSPEWDGERRELSFYGEVVKRFRWAAPNQELVLATFEEDGWPVRIDDPLPPQGDQDPKRRIHDTIKALNRNHIRELIRFRGDGTGQGIIWETQVVPLDSDNIASHKSSRVASRRPR